MDSVKARLLPYVVFCAGAAGMSLQLVGSRLLAPHFGNSIFVWTSLIGVMLGFMALGNFLGGRLADRITSSDLLFWVLTLLSMSISLVAMIGAWALGFFAEIESLRTGMVLGSAMLFAIPCTLFGIVLPSSIRLRMQAVSDSGANVGTLSAVSMMGNIAGTFITGFWLIALVGSRSLLAWIALLILLLATIMGLSFRKLLGEEQNQGNAKDKKKGKKSKGQNDSQNTTPLLYKAVALGCAALLLVGAFIWHPQSETTQDLRLFDSLYGQYFVGNRVVSNTDGELSTVQFISNNPRALESAVYAETLEPFYFEYYGFYDLAAAISASPHNTLMIGGGAFVYPRFFFDAYPQAHMDVIEIDPALLDEAKENFGFEPHENLGIYLEDGRMFLNRAVQQSRQASNNSSLYDFVIMDAFNSANNVPFQLTTLESMQHCADLMTDDGVFVMNMIASIEGEGSQFLASQYLTLRAVFPQVEVFTVNMHEVEAGRPRNVAIIATKSETNNLLNALEQINPQLASQTFAPDISEAMVLTDDFAPVDQMLMGVNQ
ncbi:MAG: fused MFS/spermidine synthase [Coriobacteriia bacterium]|nr:fused MFS/spermidine synthase [Coriobacteriia bacterium]